jgi:hypothetical protein
MVLGLTTEAAAQAPQGATRVVDGAFSVQRFSAPAGPRNFIMTRGARTDGEHAFSFGFMANYAKAPFVLKVDNQFFEGDTTVVQNLGTGDVLASYTPIPNVQIGLRIPITFAQGQGVNPFTGAPADLERSNTLVGPTGESDAEKIQGVGLGDPELEAKFRLLGEPEDVAVLGVALFATAPLGEKTAKGSYIGDQSIGGGGRVIFDGNAGPASFGLNLGYRFRKAGLVGETDIGSEAVYGLAGAIRLGPVVRLVADAFGGTQFSGVAGTNSLEALGALQITPLGSGLAITAGGGAGLIQGSVGVPKFRAVLGFSYAIESNDQDDDGIDDAGDQCPTDGEDVDGFEDADGCPELDNDNDIVTDDIDKCPENPEDIDGFQDGDGCPDDDNDKDGIQDLSDKCPEKAETLNGFEDEDGCPDIPDSDKDGVADPDDKCPNEAEDTDGFEDTDGCPDPDNDGDGISDENDECVDIPEDGAGKRKDDGCPDD